MRLPQGPADAAILSTLIFPFLSAAAGNINCEHTRVDGTNFVFTELGGPRSVFHNFVLNPTTNVTTTYTLDICKALGKVKDIPSEEQCPNGSRVCAIKRLVKEDSNIFEEAIPIAGELRGNGGKDMNAKWARLKTSSSHADSEKEGLRLEMNGGFHNTESGRRAQKAIVEFICDKDRTGLENLYDPEDKYAEEVVKRAEGDDANDDGSDSPSLRFVRYEEGSDEVDILRLEWRTKWACESAKDEKDAEKGTHWGFFTWFILIAFLSTAAYLIFGSWLNYNRYGARGWDLLPHGDTIRDVPYLFKDWMRRVLNTIQGGGSKGGYAAV